MGEVISRCYDMTISRADFLRLLPAAVGGEPYREEAGDLLAGDDARGWQIRLTPLEERVMGALRLPRQRVEFAFFGYGADEVEKFMRRFDLHYRRGGG